MLRLSNKDPLNLYIYLFRNFCYPAKINSPHNSRRGVVNVFNEATQTLKLFNKTVIWPFAVTHLQNTHAPYALQDTSEKPLISANIKLLHTTCCIISRLLRSWNFAHKLPHRRLISSERTSSNLILRVYNFVIKSLLLFQPGW